MHALCYLPENNARLFFAPVSDRMCRIPCGLLQGFVAAATRSALLWTALEDASYGLDALWLSQACRFRANVWHDATESFAMDGGVYQHQCTGVAASSVRSQRKRRVLISQCWLNGLVKFSLSQRDRELPQDARLDYQLGLDTPDLTERVCVHDFQTTGLCATCTDA